MDDRGENMRRQRLEQARAIFRHEKFLAMPAEIKRKIMHELVLKGLALDELKVLLQEAEDTYGNVPQVAQDRKEESLRAYLQTLPYDVFLSIITKGDITGTDLIRLCNSSSILRDYCNQSRIINGEEHKQFLFRQLLAKMGKQTPLDADAREWYKYYAFEVPAMFASINRKLSLLGKFYRVFRRIVGSALKEFYPENVFDLLYNTCVRSITEVLEGGVQRRINSGIMFTIHQQQIIVESVKDPDLLALFNKHGYQEFVQHKLDLERPGATMLNLNPKDLSLSQMLTNVFISILGSDDFLTFTDREADFIVNLHHRLLNVELLLQAPFTLEGLRGDKY